MHHRCTWLEEILIILEGKTAVDVVSRMKAMHIHIGQMVTSFHCQLVFLNTFWDICACLAAICGAGYFAIHLVDARFLIEIAKPKLAAW